MIKGLLALLLLISACVDNSPSTLKKLDERKKQCEEDCKPRQVKEFGSFAGCQCVP